MSPAVELVLEACRRGIAFEVAGDRVTCDGAKGSMTPDLLDGLRAHRDDVIRALAEGLDVDQVGALFPGSTVAIVFDPREHQWGVCSICGEGALVARGTTPGCMM